MKQVKRSEKEKKDDPEVIRCLQCGREIPDHPTSVFTIHVRGHARMHTAAFCFDACLREALVIFLAWVSSKERDETVGIVEHRMSVAPDGKEVLCVIRKYPGWEEVQSRHLGLAKDVSLMKDGAARKTAQEHYRDTERKLALLLKKPPGELSFRQNLIILNRQEKAMRTVQAI